MCFFHGRENLTNMLTWIYPDLTNKANMHIILYICMYVCMFVLLALMFVLIFELMFVLMFV